MLTMENNHSLSCISKNKIRIMIEREILAITILLLTLFLNSCSFFNNDGISQETSGNQSPAIKAGRDVNYIYTDTKGKPQTLPQTHGDGKYKYHIYEDPKVDGYPLDLCFDMSRAVCGQAVANDFCKEQTLEDDTYSGYSDAADFKVQYYAPPTKFINSYYVDICDNKNCHRIISITCRFHLVNE